MGHDSVPNPERPALHISRADRDRPLGDLARSAKRGRARQPFVVVPQFDEERKHPIDVGANILLEAQLDHPDPEQSIRTLRPVILADRQAADA
jgi:hypothetical protein